MSKLRSLILTIVIGCIGACATVGAIVSTEGCGKPIGPIITPPIANLLDCLLPKILSIGITDPIALAAACGGVAIEDIIAVIEAFLASPPALDAGDAMTVSAADLARLNLVLVKAHGLLAAHPELKRKP